MNEDKIIGLSDRLNEIVDEANRHPNGTPGRITWDKAIYAIEALSEEANSKPVMPNFFDRWIKENGCNEYLLVFYLSRFLATWVTYGDNETDIREWVYADPYRFNMCIDAILNGYEVKNEKN